MCLCHKKKKKGKFLGFLVSSNGIKPNPKKVQAILSMTAPWLVKEIQRLIGRLDALNWFITCLREHTFLFFKTLRNIKKTLNGL